MAVLAGRFVREIIVKEFFLPAGANGKDGMHGDFSARIAPESNVIRRHSLLFFRSAALVLFAHGLKFAVILRAFFGGCFTALATKGNGGWIFLCHARIVQKAVAVCKRELCINSNYNFHLTRNRISS